MVYSTVFALILAGALLMMLRRIGHPGRARAAGEVVGEVRLSFKERIALQRMNVYAIGIVLILAALTRSLPTAMELAVACVAVGLLFVPVRYLITSQGVAMNHLVFREWVEFTGFEINGRGVRLLPRAGLRPFDFRALDEHEEELIVLFHRCSRCGGPETGILRRSVLPGSELAAGGRADFVEKRI